MSKVFKLGHDWDFGKATKHIKLKNLEYTRKIISYHQCTKYLRFDWSMKTQCLAYLKVAQFWYNLMSCQPKITVIFEIFHCCASS